MLFCYNKLLKNRKVIITMKTDYNKSPKTFRITITTDKQIRIKIPQKYKNTQEEFKWKKRCLTILYALKDTKLPMTYRGHVHIKPNLDLSTCILKIGTKERFEGSRFFSPKIVFDAKNNPKFTTYKETIS